MGKTIEITLEQLERFLKQPYHNRFLMLESAVKPLEDAFEGKVFTNHNDTWQIGSKRELAVLIAQGGKSHTPGKPRKGKRYNNEYLVRKMKHMGENRPHVYENRGFLDGTELIFTGEAITMSTRSIMQRGWDYLAYHETQRSVLKLTFLRAWQNIIDNMINALANEAKSL